MLLELLGYQQGSTKVIKLSMCIQPCKTSRLIKSNPCLTCALQWHSPPQCPGLSWRHWDTSCTPSGLSLPRHPRSETEQSNRMKDELMIKSLSMIAEFSIQTRTGVRCMVGLSGWYHVGLPAFGVDTVVNAPPEVILWLSLPCKHRYSYRRQNMHTHNFKGRGRETWALTSCLGNRSIRG